MFSNKLAVALVGLLALAGAAGAGAFIASREAPRQSAAAIGDRAGLDAAQPATGQPVEATEAVMDDVALEPPAVNAVTPAPTPPKPAKAAAPTPPARRQSARRAEAPTPPPVRRVEARPSTARRPVNEPAPVTSDRSARRPSGTTEPADTWPATDAAHNERRPIDPVAPLPAEPRFEEFTVPADAVIGLELESSVSSETARVEDRVEARVTRDVRSNGRVVVPAGSRVLGSVSAVERGGKMKERARLGVRFHTLVLADGTGVALQTETV